MRLISNNYLAGESPSLLSRLGHGLLPLWLRGKRRQHHYRLQIRCEDRADMAQVLDLVNRTLHPAGLHPAQSMTPARGDARMLVLSLCCTPPQRRYLVQFVHQVGATRPVRWELRPDSDPPARH
ncbi:MULTISPECIES: hypothetical protein [Aeromonas]|uniref:hypothetical protein n=1 Tax=Aeromonas TaxID=642 RepID=UPI0002198047|nr:MULTISPECIES: hypothetical protein [Aeromonas]MBP4060680.1 hypothetical protein [Aeromonas sp. Prich7-2]MDH0351997.1 hypothetical protein [Aeromonas caviae]